MSPCIHYRTEGFRPRKDNKNTDVMNRNRRRKLYSEMAGTVALAASLLLGACSDDTFREGRDDSPWAASDHICFGISETGTSRTTRAAGGAEERTTGNFVLRGEGTADTLCMRAYVTDGIEGAALGEKGAATRATQVTDMQEHTSFRVLAYWKKNDELVTSTFFMNETVTYANNGWSTEKPHYWPGSGHTLSFCAWAPASITGPESPESHVLEYEVPENVNDVTDEQGNIVGGQKDVVVAVENDVPGDNYKTVGLEFDHICTAVRFVVGGEMQAGTIKRVTLKNIKYKGTYDMSTGNWIFSDEDEDENKTKDFSQELNKTTTAGDAAGTAITDEGDGYFMMLPQELGEGAAVEVAFTDAVTGNERTLSASIEGQEWQKGTTVTYKLSIKPDYTVTFEPDAETVDAHYVIFKTTMKIEDIKKDWTLKVSADDEADVSIQFEEDVNQYAKSGFWTDKVIKNNVVTSESARGSSTVEGSGSGEQTVYVFAPENPGDKDRIITLSLEVDGNSVAEQQVTQKCPAWVDGQEYGWEQIDDNQSGEYGFNWDRKVNYIFPYNLGMGILTKYTKDEAKEIINAIIEQYDAENYTSIVEFAPSLGTTRVYVAIDYGKLNSLSGKANSSSNGLQNTKDLNDIAGTANTGSFELALQNTYKTESGHESEHMFRLPDSDETDKVPAATGTNNLESGILDYVLKKNKYNIVIDEDTDKGITTTSVVLNDIVWYLPAYGQFTSLPEGISSDYWSSTATDNSAYLGSGTEETDGKDTVHSVRVMRNKPTE